MHSAKVERVRAILGVDAVHDARYLHALLLAFFGREQTQRVQRVRHQIGQRRVQREILRHLAQNCQRIFQYLLHAMVPGLLHIQPLQPAKTQPLSYRFCRDRNADQLSWYTHMKNGANGTEIEPFLATRPSIAQRWMTALTRHVPPGQFFRYLLVGGWNTLFGYGVYAAFTALLLPRMHYGYILASALSSLISITVAFFGYKFFVFKTAGNYLSEWLRCLIVYGSGSLPGLLLLPFLVTGLHSFFHLERSAPYVAGALVMGASVLYTFFGHKHFSFRVPSDLAPDAAASDGAAIPPRTTEIDPSGINAPEAP